MGPIVRRMMKQTLIVMTNNLAVSIASSANAADITTIAIDEIGAANYDDNNDNQSGQIATHIMSSAAESMTMNTLDALIDRVFHVPDDLVLAEDLANINVENTAELELELTGCVTEKMVAYRQVRLVFICVDISYLFSLNI